MRTFATALLFVLAARASAAPPPSVGQAAPPLSLETLIGAPEGVGAQDGWAALEGRAVVLEFWGTWCVPCVLAIPTLNELRDKLADAPIEFVSVTNEDEATVRSFLEGREVKGWVGIDADHSVFDAFGVRSLPHTVLVDAQGVVRAHTTADELNEARLRRLVAGEPIGLPDAAESADAPERIALGEDGVPAPVFTAAITPSTRARGSLSAQSGDGASRLTAVAFPVEPMIHYAWRTGPHNTLIEAELPAQKYDLSFEASGDDALHRAMRLAIQDAFGLAAQWEERETAIHKLRAVKGAPPTLRESDRSNFGHSYQNGRIEAVGVDMPKLVSLLAQGLETPVVDETGLAGRYDVSLSWEKGDAASLLREVRETLGLELAPERRREKKLVIRDAPPTNAPTSNP